MQARTGIGNTLAYLFMIGKAKSYICRDKEFEGLEPRILPILFETKIGRERLLRYLELKSKCLDILKFHN